MVSLAKIPVQVSSELCGAKKIGSWGVPCATSLPYEYSPVNFANSICVPGSIVNVTPSLIPKLLLT